MDKQKGASLSTRPSSEIADRQQPQPSQAAREAAAQVAWKSPRFIAELLVGQHDDCDAVQAFARFERETEKRVRESIAGEANVERVARAIWGAKYPAGTSWDDWARQVERNGGFDGRDECRKLARAALQAKETK